MRLRTILLILALLALASTTLGGFYYYYSLRETAIAVAHRAAAARTGMIRNQVSSFLAENLKTVKALAGLAEIRRAVRRPELENLAEANAILDHFQRSLGVAVCYLMDRRGETIASSNRREADTFVGQNFSFRPYFKLAIHGMPAKYLALGSTSGKRGAYYSYPVQGRPGYPVGEKSDAAPLGVVVIKAPIQVMEENIIRPAQGITMLLGPYGVIFSCNRPDWLFKTLWELSPEEISDIAQSRQFGRGPWPWVGLRPQGGALAADAAGREYLVYAMDIDNYLGWKIVHLQSLREVSRAVFRPLVRTAGSVVLALCLLAGLAAYYLYRKASQEIMRRQTAEEELRSSEERYRSLYHHTPAMLQSIDPRGRLIRVSQYWTEALGYDRDEVVGRKFTDFLTPASSEKARRRVLPEVFAGGLCKDVSFEFVKKNGQVIDVLFSASAERGQDGAITRSLAVLMDITQRKRTELELKRAQEKLSNYSKDLERQVRERTREITGFLQYTPAVVYMKDARGRYILVNSRHEELFGAPTEQVRGKTVHDIFPKEFADRFRANDLRVLHEKRPHHTEELIPLGDQIRHYLSVRFPILDEEGRVIRLCGISVDITDIKQAQEQLRRLSGGIMAAQEKERAVIARELHDELGQVLTALRMDAVWLARRLARGDSPAAERALAMCDLIDSTIAEVRNIAARLRPAVLDDLGLIDALEWHAADFEKRTGIPCVFRHNQVPPVSEPISVAVYRVAQEALTNAARHSGAARVEISLRAREGRLRLTVSDDGRGFDPGSPPNKGQLGVAGMHERAGLAGGRLEIRSRPGGGAEVRLDLPLGGPEGEPA